MKSFVQGAAVDRSQDTFLSGGGEMGALIRSHDWSSTPVGPASAWPQSLRTALSILLDSGYAMCIPWGADFTQFYNDAFRPILGSTKHPAALGQSTSETFAEIWDFIGPKFRRVMEEGQNTTLTDQGLGLDRNGYVEECYFTFSYSAIRDESGGVGGVLITVIETTDRVLAERRQKTLRELAFEALEAKTAAQVIQGTVSTLQKNPHDVPFALLYVTDMEGKVALAGAAGLPPELETGQLENGGALWGFSQMEDPGPFVRDVPGHLGTIQGLAYPEPVTQVRIHPIRNASRSGTTGFLVTGINPRHVLDDPYANFLNSVAEQVATALVKVSAYEEERKRAEALAELDRAKTMFFSNVSHEFRTPLTLMLSPLEELLAAQDAVPEHCRELVTVTYRSALRLQKLVNTLLDFSRIEAGRVQAVYQRVDLAAMTRELASTFRSAIEKAGLQFVVDCPPLSQPVLADPEMWEKIVLNLLSNAFKYTLQGSIRVQLEEQDGRALLTVQDTGSGVPESEIPRLFERFHRVEGARGRTQEGTGIGLALTAELVKLNGGTIDVRSTLGQGTSFTVGIPFGSAHLSPDRICLQEAPRETKAGLEQYVQEANSWSEQLSSTHSDAALQDFGRTEPIARQRIRHGSVLVADDNADLRAYVSRLLEEHYEVRTAPNGEEALRQILENPPDLVLSDIMMPGLDGFGLLQAIRNNPQIGALPVILLSARAGEEARIEGLDAGANDYLIKPFTARELRARVGAHMEMARVRKEGEAREARLRAEAERARDHAEGLLESMTNGFLALDKQWRLTYVNHEAERRCGMGRQDMLGRNLWDLFPGSRDTVSYQEFSRAMDEQVPVEFDNYYSQWNRWSHVKAFPSAEGLSVFFEDITEQKLADEALRKTSERLEATLNAAELGIWTWDLNANLVIGDAGAAFLFGLDPVEAAAGFPLEAYIQRVYPDDRAELKSRIEESIRQGGICAVEYRVYSADGSIRWVAARGRVKVDEEQQPRSLNGVLLDITERKVAEQALRASEDRFRQLANTMPQIVWTSRPDGFLDYYNARWYEFTGFTEDLFGDSSWVHLLHPDDQARCRDVWYASVRNGQPYNIEYRFWDRHENRWRWFMGRALPVRDAQDRIVKWFGTCTDIDEQKRTEEELRRANQDLEQFAFSASHDLQEPLRNVALYSQLVKKRYSGKLDAQADEFLGHMVEGARRMGDLVTDLLAYTRAATLKDSEPVPPVEASQVYDAVLQGLQQQVRETAAVVTHDPLPLVPVKEVHLHQLLQNLIGNSLKYRHEERAPRVHLSALQMSQFWQFSVRDNGIGIAPEFQDKVFGIFKRLHAGGSKYSGTGIGLAICQKIVERYGGRIWLDSDGEQGTAFHFTLPVAFSDFDE